MAQRLTQMDKQVPFHKQLEQDTGPIVLINKFNVGSDALRGRFLRWFDGFQGSIDMESRDLTVLSSDDIAVAYWLSRASGTLANGREVGSWVRATSCCQRSGQGWLVTREHVSFPVDVVIGSVAMDEQP